MEVSCKRKHDSIAESMNTFVPDSSHMDFYNSLAPMDRANKKVKISFNARVEPVFSDGLSTDGNFHEPMGTDFFRSASSCSGSIQMEDEGAKSMFGGSSRLVSGNDEEMEDIPSTSEVINSLRKVILWMSAQEDSSADFIEYLANLERYALSKTSAIIQQRKITDYLVRN